MTKVIEEIQNTKKEWKYQCPACTGTAIETTNQMLNVTVVCLSCGATITLTEQERYIKI